MFLYKHFVRGPALGQVEQVIANLRHVLGSKRGTGYFLRNFGLSEVGFRTPEEMVTTVNAELRENIRLYEPRVELLAIDEDYDDDGHRARLVVSLRLRGASERLQVVFDLRDSSLSIDAVDPARAP